MWHFCAVAQDSWPGRAGESGFDAHAVYAGDNAVSASGRVNLATDGVRSTLAALLNRFNLTAAAQSLHNTGTITITFVCCRYLLYEYSM